MNLKIKEGDIVLAPFRFSETEEKKLRPCLVWKVYPVAVMLIYISSQHVCEDAGYPTEVGLSEKESLAIGLLKRSRIDFSKTDKCLLSEVRRVLGNISALSTKSMRRCAEAAEKAGLINP